MAIAVVVDEAPVEVEVVDEVEDEVEAEGDGEVADRAQCHLPHDHLLLSVIVIVFDKKMMTLKKRMKKIMR